MIVKNFINERPLITPAVYDDAIVYMEQIKILDSKLNEVIDLFNELEYSAVDTANEYTDKKVEEIRTEINTAFESYKQQINTDFLRLESSLKDEIAASVVEMKSELQNIIDQVNDLVADTRNKIDQLQISVNTLFDALSRTKLEMRADMEKGLKKIMDYVDRAVVAKYGTGIIVFNPLQQKNTNLNTALEDLYRLVSRIWSLTVDEYKSLGLTVEQYENLRITTNEYLYHGKLIFFRELYFPNYEEDFQKVYDYIDKEITGFEDDFYMISPFDGKPDLIKNVVNKLADLHRDGITVDQYVQAHLTVDEYAEKHIGAHDYAWNGYYLINTDAVPKETLEEQIRELQKVVAQITSGEVQKADFDRVKTRSLSNEQKADANALAINAVNNSLTTLDGRVAVVEKAVSGASETLTSLEGRTVILENAVSGVNESLTSLEGRTVILENAVSGVNESLTSLEGRTVILENAVSGVNETLNSIDKKITDEVDGLNDTLTTRDQAIEKQIAEINTDLEGIKEDVDTNMADVTKAQKSADDIKDGLNSINIVY